VDAEIGDLVEPEAWERYLIANAAEQDSLRAYFKAWRE
jgi:hypothetical protein